MLEDFQKEESTNTTFWAIAIAVVGIFLFVYTRNDDADVTAEGANTAASEQHSQQVPKAEEHIKEEDEKPIEAQASAAIEAKREGLAEDEDLPDEIDMAAGKVLEKLGESENVADKPVPNEPKKPSTKQTATPEPERAPQAESTTSPRSKSQDQPAAAQPEQAAPTERGANTKASQPAKQAPSAAATDDKTKRAEKPASEVKPADIDNPY